MKKWLVIIVCLAIAAGLVVGGFYLWQKNKSKQTASTSLSTDNRPSATEDSAKLGTGKLYMGIMVHIEGWSDKVPKVYLEHSQGLENYAKIFEKHSAKMTIESGEDFMTGSAKANDNILAKLEERGHAIGLHADVGGRTNETNQADFATELIRLKTKLEGLGVTVRHVSGICSDLDWVKAANDAGFKFVTGISGFCAKSLSPIPAEYANLKTCKTAAECHEVIPSDPEDRIHPWYMESGRNWLMPAKSGLVALPGGGGLSCREEAQTNTGAIKCDLTQKDLDLVMTDINATLKLTDPNQINIFYLAWSYGSKIDEVLLEKWLTEMDKLVDAGKIEWKTLPEMYDAFIKK